MKIPGTLSSIQCAKLWHIVFSVCLLAYSSAYAADEVIPEIELEEKVESEIIWEFDPYYTNVAAYIPLARSAIPTITSDNEFEIYSELIEGSAIPRYMLLEASIYPMPALGTYLKHDHPDFYRGWEVGKGGSNLLESATAGFQEPWAVSAFFGNIAKLTRPDSPPTGSNFGYTGYLLSAGSKHIKENVLLDDNWYELEWKIKGKRDYPSDKQIWSFRIGGKFHDNPYITNVVYLSIHRSNLNSKYSFLDWMKNTEVDLKVHFSQSERQLVRLEMIWGKKYPLAGKDYTPTLNAGFIWSSPYEYDGILRNRNDDSITLVLRPSIEF